MRVRKRYAVMLTIAAMIAGVVIFQAVTAKPPEPYVELIGSGLPPAPVALYGCSAVEGQMILYTTGDGRQLEPVPTGHPCGHGGLGPTTPER